jgi:GTP cyclohydrolase II
MSAHGHTHSPTHSPLELYSETNLPTEWGDFKTRVYRGSDGREQVAIFCGDPSGDALLARIHSACFTGEALSSLKCDCKAQLEGALQRIQREGRGVVVYLFQEGRGIGLGNKIKAYALQERGADTVDANTLLGFGADERAYGDAVEILNHLGAQSVRLLTNNPLKVEALEAAGLRVSAREPLEVGRNAVNTHYLDVKRDRMRHALVGRLREREDA